MSDRIERLPFAALAATSFDEVIDVRAPEEYAIDHVTGALNLPVLRDGERAHVGLLHREGGSFQARKIGAGLVSANIGTHFADHFSHKPKDYRPVLYCWRGGQRSRSLATVLSEVGWRPIVIEAGYKGYRRHVMETIGSVARFQWQVLNGFTGSGKTLILHALGQRGAQVLDLEGLANHKGSLFGGDLQRRQPSQKRFESLIYDQIAAFVPDRPVFVEAEGPKIGHLNIPAPLWHCLRQSAVTEIRSPVEARTDYLRGDYASWMDEPERVLATLERLRPFHSAAQIERWTALCRRAEWKPLIQSLLTEHYDRRYSSAGSGHYQAPEKTYVLENQSAAAIDACADGLLGEAHCSAMEQSV